MSGTYNILILGDIHQGKSQIVDALRDKSDPTVIGPEILEVGGQRANGEGTTKGCPCYWGPNIAGRRIRIYDTPGISDGTAFMEQEEDPSPSPTASQVGHEPGEQVAAGAGGLLKLLENTFLRNQIHLVLIVHPSLQTGITMGPRFLQALLDTGLVAGNDDALNNIKLIFSMADLLEPPKMSKIEKIAQLRQLEKVVLKLYFPRLFNAAGEALEDAKKSYCQTWGKPVRPPRAPPRAPPPSVMLSQTCTHCTVGRRRGRNGIR